MTETDWRAAMEAAARVVTDCVAEMDAKGRRGFTSEAVSLLAVVIRGLPCPPPQAQPRHEDAETWLRGACPGGPGHEHAYGDGRRWARHDCYQCLLDRLSAPPQAQGERGTCPECGDACPGGDTCDCMNPFCPCWHGGTGRAKGGAGT